MATGYQMDFTDQTGSNSFELREYTSNGPVHPNSTLLDPKANQATTSLLLVGRGFPDYGERLQENTLHLLEHFASPIPPSYPVRGQVWHDTSTTPYQLRVHDALAHRIVVDVDNPSDNTWVALQHNSDQERDEALALYVSSFKIRVFDQATNSTTDYLISTAPGTLNGAGLVHFQISTSVATITNGNHYVGSWQPLIQRNVPLAFDFDAGNNHVVNLATPTVGGHAANKQYVDDAIGTAIGGVNSIDALVDTVITTPATEDILVYDASLVGGSGGWKNVVGSTRYLPLAGGTLNGVLRLTSHQIKDVADPTDLQDAATKKYVDDTVASAVGGGATDLDGLTDVILNVGSIDTNSTLTYNGTVWVDTSPSAFITAYDLVERTGTAFTGSVFLAADPTAGNEAATKDYVDTEIASQVAAAQDGVVDNVTYDVGTQTLTLSRTQGLPDLTTSFAGAGGVATNINYTTYDPNDWVNNESDSLGFAIEQMLYNRPLFPNVDVADVLDHINAAMGEKVIPKGRLVFVSNGNGIINLDAGSVVNQCNPTLTVGSYEYAVGSNRLEIYVNGVKRISSEHGFRAVYASTADFYLWPGTKTGLNPANTYTFNISVNGQPAVTVSVLGSAAQNLGQLADAINAQTDTNYHDSVSPNSNWAFGVKLYDGTLKFFSSLPGTGSSIDLTDGATNPLFANIVGDAGTTGTFAISDVTTADTNFYSPADYGYNEIGRVGRKAQQIELLAPLPASGSTIEVVIEHDMFAESAN